MIETIESFSLTRHVLKSLNTLLQYYNSPNRIPNLRKYVNFDTGLVIFRIDVIMILIVVM